MVLQQRRTRVQIEVGPVRHVQAELFRQRNERQILQELSGTPLVWSVVRHCSSASREVLSGTYIQAVAAPLVVSLPRRNG